MAWHPRLTARFGRGGGIWSPTTSHGYAFTNFIAIFASVTILVGAIHVSLFVALALILLGILLRDAWAWFGSSMDERRAFAELVREHTAARRR